MFTFTSGRIRNILADFGAFLAVSQNTLIPVLHVLENLMKKLKISPFGKIKNAKIWSNTKVTLCIFKAITTSNFLNLKS